MARASSTLALLAALVALPAGAATFTIVNLDDPGEGLNDAAPPILPAPGNDGSTLGAQRLIVFQAAADFWGGMLKSSIPIQIDARFDPLFCGDVQVDLGTAEPLTVHRDFQGAPVAATWYVQALANSRSAADLAPFDADVTATFNSRLDDADPGCNGGQIWWYGLGVPAPPGRIDLFGHIVHELAHGLGFLSLHDPTTGAKHFGFDDAYLRHLYDLETGEAWSQMTDAERLASQVNQGALVWAGPSVTAAAQGFDGGVAGGHLLLFAPLAFQPGVSVEHWDFSLTPSDLMEPFVEGPARDYVTYRLLEDLGWGVILLFKDSFESGDDDFWTFALPRDGG